MREGWKCPVCGNGISPDVKVCQHAEQKAAPTDKDEMIRKLYEQKKMPQLPPSPTPNWPDGPWWELQPRLVPGWDRGVGVSATPGTMAALENRCIWQFSPARGH